MDRVHDSTQNLESPVVGLGVSLLRSEAHKRQSVLEGLAMPVHRETDVVGQGQG